MSTKIFNISAAILLSTFCVFLITHQAQALDVKYEPLVGIPGFENQDDRKLSEYVNFVYMTLVALGALLAMLKISIAGAKYMMSDVVTSKGEAKKDIQGAILGLAILLIPYIVLNTINSQLTDTNVLDGAPQVTLTKPGDVTKGGAIPVGSKSSGCSFKVTGCAVPLPDGGCMQDTYDNSECYVGAKGCVADLRGKFAATSATGGLCTYTQ